jgi:hypothetical protein
MHFLLVLDCDSPIGRVHAVDHDGTVLEGERRHPVLRCSDVMYGSAFLDAIRAAPRVQLVVPHTAVVAVYKIPAGEALPSSFRPSESRADRDS